VAVEFCYSINLHEISLSIGEYLNSEFICDFHLLHKAIFIIGFYIYIYKLYCYQLYNLRENADVHAKKRAAL